MFDIKQLEDFLFNKLDELRESRPLYPCLDVDDHHERGEIEGKTEAFYAVLDFIKRNK